MLEKPSAKISRFWQSMQMWLFPHIEEELGELTEKQQEATGVTPELIRLSVGLEDLQDLKTDLEQAFLA